MIWFDNLLPHHVTLVTLLSDNHWYLTNTITFQLTWLSIFQILLWTFLFSFFSKNTFFWPTKASFHLFWRTSKLTTTTTIYHISLFFLIFQCLSSLSSCLSWANVLRKCRKKHGCCCCNRKEGWHNSISYLPLSYSQLSSTGKIKYKSNSKKYVTNSQKRC